MALSHHAAGTASPWPAEADAFRGQLGLPAGPVIASGHQAEFWHPGILAKHLAASACAAAINTAESNRAASQPAADPASAVWLVVDQDRFEAADLAVPVLTETGERRTYRLPARPASGLPAPSQAGSPASKDHGVPAAHWPAVELAAMPPGLHPATAPADAGVRRLAEALAKAQRDASTGAPVPAARQITRAYAALLAPIARPVHVVYATDVNTTALFRAFVARLVAEAPRAISAYNLAAASFPAAGLRPLDEARGELPLWRFVLAGGVARREPVIAGDAGSITDLHPKALVTTALVRLAGCDLFVHGTGGFEYDRATDAWLRAWLGPSTRLAPTVLATATMLLDMPGVAPPSPRQAARAAHEAHAARHNPGLVGDAASAAGKRAMVEHIAALPRGSIARAHAYRRMHEELAAYRSRAGERLAALDRAAASARAEAGDDPALARTWACPLYPPEALDALRARIDAAFGRPG